MAHFRDSQNNCSNFRTSTCGSTVTQNCTYISNPSYPTSEAVSSSCSYTVTPISSDICQLRLDFDNFDLTEATPITGACIDTFDVTSGSSRDYYALCGTLSGQHSKSSMFKLFAIYSNYCFHFEARTYSFF